MLEISVRQYNKYLEDKRSTTSSRRDLGSTASQDKVITNGNKVECEDRTHLSWARVIGPLDSIMGRIDVSLQALSEFLQYTAVPVEGNATHAVHIFTSQWPGEHKVEEGKLLAGLPRKTLLWVLGDAKRHQYCFS